MRGKRVEVRIAKVDRIRRRVTAAAEGLTLSEWIRRQCNKSTMTPDDLKEAINDAWSEMFRTVRKAKLKYGPVPKRTK